MSEVPARECECGQMSSETLSLKEERLGKAIDIIRAGCEIYWVAGEYDNVIAVLRGWCSECEDHLRKNYSKEFWPSESQRSALEGDLR